MKPIPRRKFLKAGAGLVGICLSPSYLKMAAPVPPLSFSTLGCPDWPFGAVLDFAQANGYSGIEIRGIQREMDLPQCPVFSTPEKIGEARRKVEDKGLKIVNLGSSAEMHHLDPKEKSRHIQDAKRFIDLAYRLKCPNVRVFPNSLPANQDRNATLDAIGKAMQEIGEFARGSQVSVLMETHGDLVQTNDILHVMQVAALPNTGLVWDVYNMWTITHESPSVVYEKIKPYIHHTHIKDGRKADGKENYLLLGKGECPIFEAIDSLVAGGYSGYYSFEWEKLWHPEIAEPELALADYPKAMKEHFANR